MELDTKSKASLAASVRWRIATMVVALSSLLYLILAGLGVFAFDWSLNYSIDNQLRVVASEIGHAIKLENGVPKFRNWLRVVKTEPAKSIAAIQLYSLDARLLERYGPPGPSSLIPNAREAGGYRIHVSPLFENNKVIGYLQLAMPVHFRDEAKQKLALTVGGLAPVLLLGLGLISYIVSDLATAPIRQSLKLLKQFVADASHELNTPIGIMRARAEVLKKKLSKLGYDLEDVQIIESATERMEKIVNDLMLLAEIDAAITVQTHQKIVLDAELKRIVDEFKPKFREKNIALSLSESESLVLNCSEESIRRIVGNLIENAWKYTDPSGSVFVSISRENERVKIEVADTGIGIPAESIPHIFDRFYRVDKSRSRASGGAGLGLSIVKALIENHGGELKVSSKEGEGSVFTVYLPVEAAV